MKFWGLVFLLVILQSSAMAARRCVDLFALPRQTSMFLPEPAVESILQHEYADSFEDLKSRLKEPGIPPSFIKIEKLLEPRQSHLDVSAMEALERMKWNVRGDLKIPPIAANPAEVGATRPDSPYFRLKHWDWNQLPDYFATKPSRMVFTRLRDLSYLRFALSIAESQHIRSEPTEYSDYDEYKAYPEHADFPAYSPNTPYRPKPLHTMSQVAASIDHQWHLWHLRQILPEEAKKYEQWHEHSGYARLTYPDRARAWTAEARTPAERAEREKFIRYSAEFRQHNRVSSFDHYILERYFALVRDLDAAISTETMAVDTTTALTQWEALRDGLARGSLDYLEAFLDHNSHDTVRKAYLIRVLDEMHRTLKADPRSFLSLSKAQRFQNLYRDAFRRIEAATADIPAPPHVETDLHVFTVVGQRAEELTDRPMPEGTIVDPVAVQIKVSWNPKLGKLESNIVKSIPLADADATVLEAMPELKPLVTAYFNRLRRQKNTWTAHQVQTNEDRELNALMLRSTFFVAMKPGEFAVNELVAMSRIFYGGPRAITRSIQQQTGLTGVLHKIFKTQGASLRQPSLQKPVVVGHPETFVELDFPDLELPERKSNQPVWELGRLLTTSKAVANSSLGMVHFMSDYFLNMGERGMAYMDAGAGQKELYQAMGAREFENPKPLTSPGDYKPVWILNADLMLMKNHYGRKNYEAIRLRENRKARESGTH